MYGVMTIATMLSVTIWQKMVTSYVMVMISMDGDTGGNNNGSARRKPTTTDIQSALAFACSGPKVIGTVSKFLSIADIEF